jgi:tRNA nucleotidyltransferase/poly(A) polymerase
MEKLKIDNNELTARITEDPLKEMVFREGRDYRVYVVGGNLRDVLLDRKSRDRDFAVEGPPEELAEKIAAETGGKLVVLGKRNLYRVVLADGSTLDFSKARQSIDTDLRKRDYTVNALGWSLKDGILDPTMGLNDLERKILRMTSRDNILDDPVRIIRGYRLAGELGFEIEPETRAALRELSSRIATSKNERITLEFFRILNLREPSGILKRMFEDGVLNCIITCDNNILEEQVRVISNIREIIDVLPLKNGMKFGDIVSQNLSFSGLLFLQALLWKSSGMHLRLSSRIIDERRHLLMGEEFRKQAERKGEDLKEILFELLEALDEAAGDYFIITGMPKLLSECDRYRQIIKAGFLSTGEIMEYTGMAAGKDLGGVIRMMRRATFYREINDKRSAIEFLLQNTPKS